MAPAFLPRTIPEWVSSEILLHISTLVHVYAYTV